MSARVVPRQKLKNWLSRLEARHLSHHRHSGRLQAHQHTSYPALVFLILLSTVILAAFVGLSSAETGSDLSLTVNGPPPGVAPVIESPADGASFTSSGITISGSCEADLVVSIYRNGTASGSTMCDGSGSFSLLITLVAGSNELIAYNLDGLNQSSPPSNKVTVYLSLPPTPSPTPTPSPQSPPAPSPPSGSSPKPSNPALTSNPPTGGSSRTNPFLIASDKVYYGGIKVGETVVVDLKLGGGHAPFMLRLDWGDGSIKTVEVTTGTTRIEHIYRKSGSFQLIVRGTDGIKRQAVLSVALIVTGSPNAPITTTRPEPGSRLSIAWPIMIIALLIVLSFWLGEKYNKDKSSPPPLPAS